MVIVTDYKWQDLRKKNRQGYSMNEKLKANIDFIYKQVKVNRACADIVMAGRSGSGKSTLAMQLAKYLMDKQGKDFTLENVCFTYKDFEERCHNSDPLQVIVFDEAGGMTGRRAMSEENVRMMRLLNTIRSKQLFIIMCVPNIWDFDKSLMLDLCHLFIVTGDPKNPFKRNIFRGFHSNKIKMTYLLGKKYHEFKVRPNFIGSFSSCFTLPYAKYDQKKQNSLKDEIKNKPSTRMKAMKNARNNLIKHLRAEGKKYGEIAEIIGEIREDEVGKICRGERGIN